jgi:acyl carrier protein
LRGIVNAAGLLADGLLLGQSRADFEAPLAPKLAGSWNLHHLTAPLDLDFFVLFSSVTGVLGSPGQANYAAANAYLDALALHRRQLGLPATSIAWCPWAEVGMAAADAQRGERLKLRGMASLSPAEGIAYLEMALRTGLPQLAILPIDMARWREFYPALAEAPLFAHLDSAAQEPASAAPVEDLRALPPADRRKRVETHVRAVIAKVMRLAPRTLPDQTPLGELGLDSMMGLEIRNHLDRLLGLRMPASLVWFHPTIAALSDKIAALLDDGAAASDVLAAPTEAAAPADDLTEHELADLLSAELDDLKRRRGP